MFRWVHVLLLLGLAWGGFTSWGAVEYETDPARPGQIFIPDPSGEGGWWYRQRPGASRPTKEGGVSAAAARRMQRQLSQGLKPPISGESATAWAAITCYWQNGRDTDSWTRHGQSSTGVALRQGIVAVDPQIIPYGSIVQIDGVEGYFLAADCGRDVKKRVAVKKTARTAAEKKAIVVDVFFKNEKEGRNFDRSLPSFVRIRYYPPTLVAQR